MTDSVPPPGLSEFIEANLEPILQEWEAFARSLMPLANLDRVALRDHAEEMLDPAPGRRGQRQGNAQGRITREPVRGLPKLRVHRGHRNPAGREWKSYGDSEARQESDRA